MKITYSVATSRDGFIAREDGDVSWLNEAQIDMSETGLEDFFASIGGLVMGRGTYDFVFDYGSWPYEDKPAWVCTHRELQRLAGANMTVVEEIDDVLRDAATRGIEHLWLLGGGRLASSFLAMGWITHLSICELPIELGAGIPLFSDHKLEDIAAVDRRITEKNGFRQVEIKVKHH